VAEIEANLADVHLEVRRLGWIDHATLRDWYRVADITVFPSVLEAVSLGALEAMACGSAVICTATGGFLDLLDGTDAALLVPPQDPNALADALRTATDANLRAKLSARGRALAETYSWKRVADQTEPLLSGATTGAGARTRRTS
jgi:glycosyltransferase involved in cell wall biosynthesis